MGISTSGATEQASQSSVVLREPQLGVPSFGAVLAFVTGWARASVRTSSALAAGYGSRILAIPAPPFDTADPVSLIVTVALLADTTFGGGMS